MYVEFECFIAVGYMESRGNTMRKITKKQIMVLLGAFLLMMSSAVVSNSTTYFITSVTRVLQCSRAEFSIYYTVLQICTAVMSVCMGVLLSRFSTRVIFLCGSIGASVGFLIMSNIQSLSMVYVGAAFIGLFQACLVVPIVSVINTWFREHNGLAIGITMSATGFGGIVMAQIMPRVIAYTDWRMGYITCALLLLGISLLGIALIGKNKQNSSVEDVQSQTIDDKKTSENYKRVVRSPLFWMFVLACLIGDGSSMNAQHLSAHLEDHAMPINMISLVMSVFSISLAVFKIIEGYLYGRITSIWLVPVFFSIAISSFFALSSAQIPVLIYGVISFGFAGAMITSVYPQILRRIYGPRLASSLWGFCWAGIACGNAVGTPVLGYLYDMTGAYTTGFYVSAFGTLLVGSIFLFLLKYNYAHKYNSKEESL